MKDVTIMALIVSVFLFLVVAFLFGLVVEIARGITWIKWAFS